MEATFCMNGENTMNNSYLHDKKILLVDDEPELLNMISTLLSENGYKYIFCATTAKDAMNMTNSQHPDLIVLDVMLPDADGFSLMQQLRSITNVPIIFLTAKDEIIDKLNGLGLGADDYITKPFIPQELLLRINSILRRVYKEDLALFKLENSVIDFKRAQVNKCGEIIPLTAKEHNLLETLAYNAGIIVTTDAICEALWGENPFGYENSLNAHIRRIREKIELNPSKPVSLITVKGLGYKLIERK